MVNPSDGHAYLSPLAAVSPTAQANLLVASEMDVALTAALSSPDGGKTWALGNPPLPVTGPNTLTVSPAPAFDASGKLYESYLGVDRAGNTQLVLSASADGGATRPTAVVDGSGSRPGSARTSVANAQRHTETKAALRMVFGMGPISDLGIRISDLE